MFCLNSIEYLIKNLVEKGWAGQRGALGVYLLFADGVHDVFDVIAISFVSPFPLGRCWESIGVLARCEFTHNSVPFFIT